MDKAITLAIRFLAALLAASGLFFLAGGTLLALRGGSLYYLPAGAALCAAALGLLRQRAWAAHLYMLFLLGTAAWAFWENGFAFWALLARLFFFLMPGIAIAALSCRLQGPARPGPTAAWLAAGIQLMAAIALFAGMFQPHGVIGPMARPSPMTPVGSQRAGTQQAATQAASAGDWTDYGHSPGGDRFADLDQINRDTVGSLDLAWSFRTGDVPNYFAGDGTEDQNTPLFVDGTLYVCTPRATVIALDGDSGREIWKRKMAVGDPKKWVRCRGIGYRDLARDPAGPVPSSCAQRLFVNTARARLVALDAHSGLPCPGFGEDGEVDLAHGIGRFAPDHYKPTSAPTVAGQVVVVGSYVQDNVALDMPSGVVRGYDIVDGHLVWAFDTGRADHLPPTTDSAGFTRGSPNVWAPISYDAQRDLVFLPTGNTSPDLWGGNRTPTEERHGSAIIALDAATGKKRWVFQTVHHDLWDYDVPMQPMLTDFPMPDGRLIPAVIVGTKTGQIFVLDRISGKPLTRVEERRVPAGSVPGERYAPTQPFSTDMPTIGASTLREQDMWGLTPFDQLLCRVAFKAMRYTGPFDPPGLDRSLTYPGALGGLNWGGISVDPRAHMIFLNDLRLPQWYQLFTRDPAVPDESLAFPMRGAPVTLQKDRFKSILDVPCNTPPFGTMTAIDLTTRTIAWQVPMGTVQDTGPLGMKMHLPLEVGMPTLGGSLATAGGLLFFAGTQDYYVRALDSATGKVLWKRRLPVGSQGGPMSYRSPRTATQYVVITAGGARQSPDRGDYVIAYKLKGR